MTGPNAPQAAPASLGGNIPLIMPDPAEAARL